MTSAFKGTDEEKLPILIVEDNFLNQKVAMVLIQRLGLKAKLVSNGKEAVDAVSTQKFSLILMDCHMPIMDGFEATVAIRKLESLTDSYTPIIAVTALAMGGDRERCIAAGMDDYIPKPIDKDLLKVKINHWMRSDVVYNSQKMRKKFLRPNSTMTVIDGKLLDLEELEEFYGPSQLAEIIDIYVTQTQDMLNKIRTQLFERNSRAVAGLAHELKASSASIGAKQIARACLYLEQTSCQQDWMEAEETVNSIQKSFDQLRGFIESSMAEKVQAE